MNMFEEIKNELESKLPAGTHIKFHVENGEKTVADVADYIAETVEENKPTDDMKSFKFKKESILANVQYQIISKEANSRMLEDAVYKEFLDLAIIYRVMVGANAHFVVRNELMEKFDISIEELDEAARENTQNVGFTVKDMKTVMAEMFEFDDEPVDIPSDEMMYVMTNRTRWSGAAIMIYPKYFGKLADRVADDLYILPSSIHEVLAIPDRFVGDVRNLKEMVRDVNDTQLVEEERLSYSVYKYSRETGEFIVA